MEHPRDRYAIRVSTSKNYWEERPLATWPHCRASPRSTLPTIKKFSWRSPRTHRIGTLVKRLLLAVRLLLPSWKWIVGYWLAVIVILALVTLGMEATSDRSATLWGYDWYISALPRHRSNAVHSWRWHSTHGLLLALPMICFVGFTTATQVVSYRLPALSSIRT